MRIRIVNENDWEKNYDLDQSIIRIGSQVSCNIQLRDSSVAPLLMQIVRINDADVKHVIRFFAPNIMLIRGDQAFPADQNKPYDIVDGDQFTFSRYRMFIYLGDDKTRTRTSKHMSAEMFFSKRELSLDSNINGIMELKNLGTEKPCQFKMHISGIPEECVKFSPLPYLHPGASSSVGFIISHLQTKPAPGFITVSITISAPDDYFGEALEFNQDIYVSPVFNNEFVLEDDSQMLSGFNQDPDSKEEKKEPETYTPPQQLIPDTTRLDSSVDIESSGSQGISPVRIVGSTDNRNNPFDENEDEDDNSRYSRRKKKEPVVLIRHNENDAFEEEKPAAKKEPESDSSSQRASKMTRTRVKKSDLMQDIQEEAAAVPDEKLKADGKAQPVREEKPAEVPQPAQKESTDEGPKADEKAMPLREEKPAEIPQPAQKESTDGELKSDGKAMPLREEKPAEVSQPAQKESTDEKLKADEKAGPDREEKPAEVPQPVRKEITDEELKSDGKARPVRSKKNAEAQTPVKEADADEELKPDGRAKPVRSKKAAESQPPVQEAAPDEELKPDGRAKPVRSKKTAEAQPPVQEAAPDEELKPDGRAKPVRSKKTAEAQPPVQEAAPDEELKPDENAGPVRDKNAAEAQPPVQEAAPDEELKPDENAGPVRDKNAAEVQPPVQEERLNEKLNIADEEMQSIQDEAAVEDLLTVRDEMSGDSPEFKAEISGEQPEKTGSDSMDGEKTVQNEPLKTEEIKPEPAPEGGPELPAPVTEEKDADLPGEESKPTLFTLSGADTETDKTHVPVVQAFPDVPELPELPETLKQSSRASVKKEAEPAPEKTPEGKDRKNRFVESPWDGGDEPVYVVSGNGEFDDEEISAEDDQGDTSGGNDDGKPEIRVMRGGSFDE